MIERLNHARLFAQLYGHSIRIEVVSTTPVRRVVIDTVVHFFLDDTMNEPEAAETQSLPRSTDNDDLQQQPVDSITESTRPQPRTDATIRIPVSLQLPHIRVDDESTWQLPSANEKETPRTMASSLEKKQLALSQMRQQMQVG
ncbi:hypothetical protein PINS_up019957 [Pythium insidiosum]|nr:hypothetical protein PINS_up019957 [Pythium insidiosum]